MANGWPADWDERKKGRDCPLCASIGPDDNDFSIWVAEHIFTEHPDPLPVLRRRAAELRGLLVPGGES